MEKKTRLLPETRDIHSYEHYLSAREVEYGGMLAISVVFVQALLSYTAIDETIHWAFYGFALGIPLLACPFIAKAHHRFLTTWAMRLGNLGLIFSATATFAVFLHFSELLGLIFFTTGIVAFYIGEKGY